MDISPSIKNSIFGFNTTISTIGGSLGGLNQTLYVPKLFNPTYIGFTTANDGVSVSKSAGFSIQINVDNANIHDNIIFIHDIKSSFLIEKNVPFNQSIITINAADLAQCPIGASLSFIIVRGNVNYKRYKNTDFQFRASIIQHCTSFELKP